MRGNPRQRRIDNRRAGVIAAIAARQHGVITRAQLLGAGLGAGAIDGWVRRSRLHRIHHGVYLLGHVAVTPRALELAAVLACDPGAVLSHRSTAQLWKLIPYPAEPGPHDVTVTGRKPDRRTDIHVHRGSSLRRNEWLVREAVPVTNQARTLLDLAGQARPAELDQALDEAHARRLVSLPQLRRVVADHPGRAGSLALREAGGLDQAMPRFSRSPPEKRLFALLRAARLPRPETNARLHGYEVDFLWRAERLVVETDGWATHSSRPAFERDRRRDAELAARGYAVVRITWRQLTNAPEATIATIAAALARRS